MLVRLRLPAWEPAIFPLAEEAGQLLMGGLPLGAWQEAEGAAAGLPVHDAPADAPLPAGAIAVCAPEALFSRRALTALLAAARARGGVVQAAVRAGTPLWDTATRLLDVERGQDLLLPLWAGPLAGRRARLDGDVTAAFDAAPVAVCDDDSAVRVRVPPHGAPPHTLVMPAVARLGGRVRHWLHVLDLSLAALHTRRRELGLTRGRSRLGRVDIHPTATVIGSILEDGVKVEPHASVIDSFVGRDVLVADHSVIHTSVIGEGCRTLVDTSLRRVVAMRDSTLSNLGIADVVIGRGVFLTTGVATFGPPPGEDATVEGRGVGRAALGGAIGARCVLGSRALLRSGVALPPGLLVVARPGEAATKLDAQGLARATMMRGDRGRQA